MSGAASMIPATPSRVRFQENMCQPSVSTQISAHQRGLLGPGGTAYQRYQVARISSCRNWRPKLTYDRLYPKGTTHSHQPQ
jgi:hypothetical protein